MPTLLHSVGALSRLVRHAPEVVVDLTSRGALRSLEYKKMWPDSFVYAYPQGAADDPNFSPVALSLSDWPDWGARCHPSHGVLADIRLRGLVSETKADFALQSTVDRFAQEHDLKQISLLILPASGSALPILLGSSALLAAARILAVVILDQPDVETPAEFLVDVAGILGKFGYRWASIDDAAVSAAVHGRAEGILLARTPNVTRPPWLQAAHDLRIPLKGIIHVGADEARDLDLYREHRLAPIFMIGSDAPTPPSPIGRFSDASNVVHVDASVGAGASIGASVDASISASVGAPQGPATNSELVRPTLDGLAATFGFEQCNLLHLDLPAVGLSAIGGGAATLRQTDIVSVKLARAAGHADAMPPTELEELDARLRRHGFLRFSISTSVHANRDDAVFVRKDIAWARAPVRTAEIVLQQADCSISRVALHRSNAHGLTDEAASLPAPAPVRIVPPSHPGVARTAEQAEVEVGYVLQYPEIAGKAQTARAPRSRVRSDAPEPDVDVLVLSNASLATFRAVMVGANTATRLSAVIVLGPLSGEDLATAIAAAFDHGFLLDRGSAASTGRAFIRSELIREPARWLAGNNSEENRHFRFSFLGKLGRFGNQLFQLWHLILSGLRHNAGISSRRWDLHEYFELELMEKDGRADILRVEPHEWRVMGLWALPCLPDGIDFFGHFQWIPPFLQRHRLFLSRLFELRPRWAIEMAKIIAALRSSGRPLSAFHVRRRTTSAT